MIKPIFTIGVECTSQEGINKLANNLKSTIGKDYHILVYYCKTDKPIFNLYTVEKDVDQKKIEEIQELVIKQMKNVDSKKTRN